MAKWDNTGRALGTTSGIVWVWGKNTCWHLMRPPRNADVYSLRTICLYALLCGFILHNASVLPSFSADILSPGYIQTAVSTFDQCLQYSNVWQRTHTFVLEVSHFLPFPSATYVNLNVFLTTSQPPPGSDVLWDKVQFLDNWTDF